MPCKHGASWSTQRRSGWSTNCRGVGQQKRRDWARVKEMRAFHASSWMAGRSPRTRLASSLRVLSLVPRARCICRRAGSGESREATTKSELTDGLSGRNPRRGKSGGVLLFGVLPPDRHGNAVTGCSAGRHQSGAARASFTKRAPYG